MPPRLIFRPAVACGGQPVGTDCDDDPVYPCFNCRDRWIADGDYLPETEIQRLFADPYWAWADHDLAVAAAVVTRARPALCRVGTRCTRWRYVEVTYLLADPDTPQTWCTVVPPCSEAVAFETAARSCLAAHPGASGIEAAYQLYVSEDQAARINACFNGAAEAGSWLAILDEDDPLDEAS